MHMIMVRQHDPPPPIHLSGKIRQNQQDSHTRPHWRMHVQMVRRVCDTTFWPILRDWREWAGL
jgi:hypothetical protein